MLKDKKALEQYLDQQCDRIVVDNDKCKSIYTYANETYDIPKGIISDLISKRKSMTEASEFVLFILLDSIHNVLKDKDVLNIDQFYTMKEAQYYRKSKYEVEKIKFPLIFKMIQVTEDQWIGNIDAKTLMLLRNAQMISYNVNTQRVLQRIVKGDKEIYKISLNQKAVSEIKESFEKGNFISNVITLNIPFESESDFYYDKDNSSLIIKSLESFSILDGYHRFIALCQIFDLNSDFNYPLELRITNWDEAKAKTFIWQDNKKTFMKKVDRESFNLNNNANIIVERLNSSIMCNIKGQIGRNYGLINFGEIAQLVDWFYIKSNKNKAISNAEQLKIVKDLTNNFNMLTEYNTEYLEHKMSYKTLLAAMFCFDFFKDKDIDGNKICEIIEKTAKELENSDNKKFQNKTPRASLITEVEKIMKGVM